MEGRSRRPDAQFMAVTINVNGRKTELVVKQDPHSFYTVLTVSPDEGVLGDHVDITSEDGEELSAGRLIMGSVCMNGHTTTGHMVYARTFPQNILGWKQLQDLGLMPEEADFVVHVPPVLIAGGRNPGHFKEDYLKRRLIGDARRIIASWEREGLIQRSSSVCNAAVSLSLKANGKVQIHFHYSDLNASSHKEPSHPSMHRPRALEAVTLGSFYSVFRLFFAEWRIPLDSQTKYKTAFTFLGQQYVWNRLPGKYHNSSSRMSAALDKVLELLPQNMRKRVTFYYDTILISADTAEECRAFTDKLWRHLLQNSFEMRGFQCQQCQPAVQFLGREVSEEGVRLGKDFIRQVVNMRSPRSVTALRSMLGYLNDAAHYTPGFSVYSSGLSKLTGKNHDFHWDGKCEAMLTRLKDLVLANRPVVPGLATEEACTVQIFVRDQAWMAQILNGAKKPYRFVSGVLPTLKNEESLAVRELKAMKEVWKKHGEVLQSRDVEWEVESPQIKEDPDGTLNGKRLQMDFLQNQRCKIEVVPAAGRNPPAPWPKPL